MADTNISLSPIELVSSLEFTSVLEDPAISVGAIESSMSLRTTVTTTSAYPVPPNYMLNNEFYAGPIEIELSIEGETGFTGILLTPIPLSIVTDLSSFLEGHAIELGAIELTLTSHFTDVTIGRPKTNFVKWSKIGYLDFTIDESNLAGERPMDWKGAVYNILKLGEKLVVYGANGVTIMKPAEVHWGMDTIYRIGLVNKGAVAGDNSVHFFVDKLHQLWMITDQLTKLDYSEFLGTMKGTVILTYDIEKRLLYICDGTLGYIFSLDSLSFGEAPENITGLGAQGGTLYVVSAGEIDTPKFEICTDVYDFGTRKPKTIQSIEVSSDLGEYLYAAVDYRLSYVGDFRTIDWFLVNPNGKAFPKCYGVEFRFRLKATEYEYFELDYLKIRGHIHGFSYLDSSSA